MGKGFTNISSGVAVGFKWTSKPEDMLGGPLVGEDSCGSRTRQAHFLFFQSLSQALTC